MKERRGSPPLLKQLLVLLLTAYLALGAPFAQAVSAATWHVDTATGNDANACTSSTAPCESITGALGKAWTAGDTVMVHPGLYNSSSETFPLQTTDLSLYCTDQATRSCIINADSMDYTIELGGDQTVSSRVEGFTILNDSWPTVNIWASGGDTQTPVINNNTITSINNNVLQMSADNSGTTVLSPTITGNTISTSISSAVYVWARAINGGHVTASPTITGNTITSTSDDAIYFYGYATNTGSIAIFDPNISNNTLNAGGNGLNIRLMSEYNWPDTEFKPTISGNTIASAGSNGIYIWVSSAESSTMDFSPVISNNTITNPSGHGIYMWFTDCCTFEMTGSPVISGNTITGAGGDGLYIWVSLSSGFSKITPQVTNNTIKDGGGEGINYYGYYRSGIGGTISHNTITGNANSGIYLYDYNFATAYTINPVITGNTITGNGMHAIYLYTSWNSTSVPDIGGGAQSSPGYNTIVVSNSTTYDDISNYSDRAVFAMNNWFSVPASIYNSSPGTTTYSELNWTLSFTASPATVAKGGALVLTAASGSGFVTDVGAEHTSATVTIGGVPATVISATGTQMIVLVPNSAANGPASITVTNPGGQTGTLAGAVTLTDPSGVARGLNLLSPANGATGVNPASVTFQWSGISGLNGDPVVYLLYVCTDPTFESCAPVDIEVVVASAAGADGFAGGLGLIMMGIALAGGMSRRRKIALLLALMLLVSVSIIGCGSEGDVVPGSSPSPSSTTMSSTVTGLSSGTTYYWKVVAYTSDGMYESYTYSFTTM